MIGNGRKQNDTRQKRRQRANLNKGEIEMKKILIAMAAALAFSATAGGFSADAQDAYETCVAQEESQADACFEMKMLKFSRADADYAIDVLEGAGVEDGEYEAALMLRKTYTMYLNMGYSAGESASRAFGLARVFYGD